MSGWTNEWRVAVCALAVLLGACQAQEAGDSSGGEASQAATSTEAVSEAESMADEASEPEPEPESETETETLDGEAAEAGEASRDTAPAEAQEEVPMERRQVFLVEFKDPYSEADLDWLREYGARVMSENNERSVTVWFVPKKEHAWVTDERIARVTPMRR